MSITLKEASVDDVEILSRLHIAAFGRGWGPTEFASFFDRDNIVAYLAMAPGDQPVGFIFCWVVADQAELLSLGVLATHRQRGIGKQLLERAIGVCEGLGARLMCLEVNVHNKAARDMYIRLGFEATGRRKDYYKQPDGTRVDAVSMRLDF